MKSPDHRRSRRFASSVGVEIRSKDMRFPIRSLTTDVSEHGCYVRNFYPGLRKGSEVEVVLFIQDDPLVCPGVIAAVHKGIGFGVNFKTLSGLDREKLSEYLGSLPESFCQTQQMLL